MRRSHLILVVMAASAAMAADLGWSVKPWLGNAKAQIGSAAIGGPFNLVDDKGAPVTEATLRGRPSVIYFGYTYCPEVCPTTLADLARWMKALGPDGDKLNYVFVTVDPKRDTPKVMHEYVNAFDPRIRGFTGTPEQIAKIAREYHAYYQRVPTSDGGYVMDHSSMLYLMSADGKFITLIHYQEDDASAIEKLKQVLALAPTS